MEDCIYVLRLASSAFDKEILRSGKSVVIYVPTIRMVFSEVSTTATGNQPQEPHNTQPTDDEWAEGVGGWYGGVADHI